MGRINANHRESWRFGIGGDELSLPTKAFEGVYRRVGEYGMHRLIHAGEIGGPEKIREAVEMLGAERIGHGIGAIHDESLMDMLKERGITLEICPVSNLRDGRAGDTAGQRSNLILTSISSTGAGTAFRWCCR